MCSAGGALNGRPVICWEPDLGSIVSTSPTHNVLSSTAIVIVARSGSRVVGWTIQDM